MKHINLLLFLTAILLAETALKADIYEWTDKNGVKYFSNQPPPEHADDAKVIFKEYEYNGADDQKQNQSEQPELDNPMPENKADEQRTEVESPSDQQGPEQNQQLSREERIQAEKERLQKEIADLEEKPLSYFGSAKNKRVRIGYYRYCLDTLMNNPDEYFSTPQTFQGNVQEPEDMQTPTEDENPASTGTSTN
jgi:Skp family chaperone for outer membrane proteins